jgi:hypothetical protein
MAGANCVDIPGATTSTYTVTDADLGGTLRFRNTATDAQATHSADSAVVEPYIPFDTRAAEALGPGDRIHQGFFVRNSIESHCGAPTPTAPTILFPASTFLYDAVPVTSLVNEPVCLVARTTPACTTGITPTIYSPEFAPASGIATNYRANTGIPADGPGTVSWTLPAGEVAEVAATAGQANQNCATYGFTLGADGPFAAARPAISGTPVERGTLTSSDGTWSGSPAFGRAWLRCDATGAGCVPIGGATGSSYLPGAADVGRRLRVRVTATRGRSLSSDSDPSGVVAASPLPAPPGGGVAPPGPGRVPRDARAPMVRLTVPRVSLQTLVRRGWLALVATCDEACRLTATAQVTRALGKRLGGVTIASGSTSLRTGRRTTVRVKLRKRPRRSLRRRTSVSFTLRLVVADAAGNKRTITRKVTVRRRRG